MRLSPLFLLFACGSPDEAPSPSGPSGVQLVPLEVDVPAIDFGSVHEGCSARQSVRIHNPNAVAVEIDELRWVGDPDSLGSASFSDLGDDRAIAGGETVRLTVRLDGFDSFDGAELDGTLHIDTSRTTSDPEPIQVRGSYAATPIWTETFVQAEPRDTDLLFVLDDAPELEDHVLDLIPLVDGLFDTLDQHGASAQIGVVSTDDDGLLAGPWFENDATAADTLAHQLLASGFSDWSPGGWVGGPYIDAVQRTLSTGRMASEPNLGFVRPAATLDVVAIADRDTSGAWMWADLVDTLKAQKQSELDVRLHVIGPDYDGCSFGYTYGSLDEDEGLLRAQRALGGLFEPICDATQTTFTRIAQQAIRLGAFRLTEADPDLACSDVDVQVDGAFVPCSQRTLVDGQLQIHGPSVPAAGQTVTIAYPVDDTCERWDQPEG